MAISKKLFKLLPTVNGLLTVFSCIFLYVAFAYAMLHNDLPLKDKGMGSFIGIIFCIVPILIWAIKWKRLNKNYRQIAIFFIIVFMLLFFMHVRNIFKF
jgi:hypothetical protein